MNKKNQLVRLLFSMRTAIIILLLLIIACIVGSVLPQGELEAYYTGYYPEKLAELILLLDLDDVFHSLWFILLTGFLCLNLLGCNLLRFPGLIRSMKQDFTPARRLKLWDGSEDAHLVSDPAPLFEKLHFRKITTYVTAEGKTCRYASRNHLGIWGAWLTHLGMFIIIIGFALGQIFTVKYTVYGVIGQTLDVEDTGYTVTINDFNIELREDETVEQYTANITVTDTATGETVTGETSVNHPLTAFGMKFYQNSTGWAATVSVIKNDTDLLQQEILCAGEHMTIEDFPDLVIAFNAFYPDYVLGSDGMPATASSDMNNPGYLYTLYYQEEVLGMNVLTSSEKIAVDDYSIVFTDPQSYTLLQAKRDPFTWIALIGAILIILALFLSFYMRAEELWAVQNEDGSWSIAGYSKKGGLLFHESIVDAAEENREAK